jgi:hypothetical protein
MLKKRQTGAWEYLAAMVEHVVLKYVSQLYCSLRISTLGCHNHEWLLKECGSTAKAGAQVFDVLRLENGRVIA